MGNYRIQKFDGRGGYLTQWGSQGAGNGQFSAPIGIAVDAEGGVYVSDRTNNRIQKFTSSGAYVTQWGSLGHGDGELDWPLGLAVDGSGNVYVADAGNHRIQVFAPSYPISVTSESWGGLKVRYR